MPLDYWLQFGWFHIIQFCAILLTKVGYHIISFFFSSFFLATNMLLQLLALLNYTHLVGLWNCWKHCMYCTPRFLCSYIHVLYTAHCSQALLLQAHIGNLQQCFIAREQSEEYIFYSSDISCENNSFNIWFIHILCDLRIH